MPKVMTTCECGCSHGLEYGGGKIDKALLTRVCFICKRTLTLRIEEGSGEPAAVEKEVVAKKPAPKKRGRKPKPK